jgi:N-acyl-L-homoserine lactone synthetase
LLEEKASLAANYESIRDRFDEFMAKYSMQPLSEDQICCMVRFAAAVSIAD